jgi:hypothetical protein
MWFDHRFEDRDLNLATRSQKKVARRGVLLMTPINSEIKTWHCVVGQKTHINSKPESWETWSAESSRKPTKFIYLSMVLLIFKLFISSHPLKLEGVLCVYVLLLHEGQAEIHFDLSLLGKPLSMGSLSVEHYVSVLHR